MVSKHRKESANTIVLITVSIVVLLIGIGLFALNYTRLLGGSNEHHTAIEAACLTAAQDLAKIVVNDDNFGYISLSDYAPVGKGTTAGDDAPMPVLSINTVIGTARLDTIVAGELDDEVMKDLAKKDVEHARKAMEHLNNVLVASLQPGGNEDAKDYDGKPVLPFEDASRVYKGNSVVMSGGGASDNFRLTVGYIAEGATTQTQIPQPEDLSQVPADKQQNGKYKGFLNIPANGEDFYFAGVGQATSLVSGTFVANDNSKPASAVQAEADQRIVETTKDGKKSEHIVHSVALAIPAARSEDGPGGAISISFPDGLVPGINKVGDLLSNDQLKSNRSEALTPVGEDHPTLNAGGNPIDQLVPADFLGGMPTVSESWIGGFYHWIRNNKIKPRIDDLKKMQEFVFNPSDPARQDRKVNTSMLPDIIQTAYADSDDQDVVLTGLLATGPDTDKQRYEALKNNDPGAVRSFAGVAGLVKAEKILPPNCLMVGVTKDGTLVSADSKTPISMDTVYGFWTRLMETNTASLTCLGMANKVLEEIKTAEETLPAQISALRREADELRARLATPMDAATLAATQEKIRQLDEKANALTAELDALPAAKEMATRAKNNADAVARKTDCIARNQRVLSAKGLLEQGSDYLIGGVKFTPHPLPPATLQSIKDGTANSGDAANTPWTAENFYCFAVPAAISSRPNLDGHFGMRPAYAKVDPDTILPPVAKMYLFRVQPDGHVVASVMPANPYKDIKVSERQIYAVCYSALTTSSSGTPLVWTATMRDNTAKLGTKKGGQHGGEAMAPTQIGWCLDPDYSPPAVTPRFKKNSNNGNAWGRTKKSKMGQDPTTSPSSGPGPMVTYEQINNAIDKVKLDESDREMRANYICGGIASDFQLRSPLVKVNAATGMSFPRKTDLLAKVAEGSPLTINVAGQQFHIAGTSGLTIAPVPGAVTPGYTITPGTSTPTALCPPPPSDF